MFIFFIRPPFVHQQLFLSSIVPFLSNSLRLVPLVIGQLLFLCSRLIIYLRVSNQAAAVYAVGAVPSATSPLATQNWHLPWWSLFFFVRQPPANQPAERNG